MNRGQNKAFTLIESIMVMVIIGVLAALAIPRFSSFYNIKFNSAIKKVVSDIRYAQQLAVARHESYKIIFNTSNETYRALRVSDGTAVQDPFTRQPLDPWVNFSTDPQYKGINIFSTSLSGTTLRFNWQGLPQEGSSDVSPTDLPSERSVTFQYKGNNLSVYITPNTGRLRIQ